MIKVSVIITTYNGEKSIARTLNSVLHQTGIGTEFELEVIVIDDCSTDRTADILMEFNVHFYYRTATNSGGPNKGRNIGLQNATGDYICFLDHDDTWEPEKIRYQLEAVQFAPIVSCGYTVDTSALKIHRLNHTTNAIRVFRSNETFLKKLSKEKEKVQHTYLSTLMIHKDLKGIEFEENFGILDFDWVLRIFENNPSTEIALNLVSRYVHGKNLSLNAEYRKKDYYYSMMCLESFEKKYPKEVSRALKRINGSRARYYYLMGEMRDARRYLLLARPGIKEILYYITSFFGSNWVKRRFIIFG